MAALPSSNISVTMVKQAIGSGSNDVGTLCTHPNINIWSEYAPCKVDKTEGLIEAEFKKYKWKYITTFNSASGSFIAYNIPTDRFRLGDFRGYDHTTPKPEFYCGANRVDGQNTTTFIASLTFPLAYDFSNIPALVRGYKVGVIINNNTNYGIILNSDDNIEFYGSKVITGFGSGSFTYKFGLVPTNALGEPAPISSMIEFGILDGGVQFGTGSKTVIVEPDETQPTYMDFAIDVFPGTATDINYNVSNYSPGVSRLTGNFKVLENRPSGSFGVWVSVRKISDNSVVYPETLEKTITILSTNNITVDINLAYSNVNYIYTMLVAEL
jgi:hypothetical protein